MTHRRRIFQRGLNLRLAQKDVSTASTPQHALKRGDAFPQDDSRDEAVRAARQKIVILISDNNRVGEQVFKVSIGRYVHYNAKLQ